MATDESKTPDKEDDTKVEFTPPSYALKAKAPPSDKDLETVQAQVEQHITETSGDYLDYAKKDAERLGAACDALESSGGTKEAIEAVYWIAHEMKGQGGTFGYPLITAVGTSLCGLLDGRETLDEAQIEAVRLHFDAIGLVVSRPLKGEGGSEGTNMVDGLRKVVEKVGG